MRTSKPITVTLGPQLTSLEAHLKSGEYAWASEILRSALRVLDRQDAGAQKVDLPPQSKSNLSRAVVSELIQACCAVRHQL